MIDFIVFDMAGTTVTDKNYVGKAFLQAFARHDIAVEEKEINPIMGYPKPTAIQMVLERRGIDFDEELVSSIHQNFVHEMLDFYEHSPVVQPMPDAEDLFFYLKEKGIKIALNTGFSRDIAEIIIERFQWLDRGLIDDFIASDEVEQGRPYPYMIELLKQRNGIGEEERIMKVGDTIVDILEGRAAQCFCVVSVTTGSATAEELKEHNPDFIINSLAELPVLLNREILA